MIITVGNIKGGVGKSTIACNLAVMLADTRSGSVALIDGDKQGSSAEFASQRDSNKTNGAEFTSVRAVGAEVRQQVKGMKTHYSHIVIDAGGQDNPALRAALTVSDVVLVPVPPKSFEAWSLDVMADLVSEVRDTVNPKIKAFAFINLGFAQGGDNDFAKTLIKEDYPVFDLISTTICQRKAFSDGVGQGLAVTETKPRDAKAINEFLSVMEHADVLHSNLVSVSG